jgi:lysophospholipase L1-like esterase
MCVVQSRVSKPTAQAMAVNEDRDLAITATALGWPVCDPTQDIIHELDAAKVPADALWVSKDDMHPNPKAHEIIAKDLAKALIEN